MIVKDKEPMFEEIESSQTVTIGGVDKVMSREAGMM